MISIKKAQGVIDLLGIRKESKIRCSTAPSCVCHQCYAVYEPILIGDVLARMKCSRDEGFNRLLERREKLLGKYFACGYTKPSGEEVSGFTRSLQENIKDVECELNLCGELINCQHKKALKSKASALFEFLDQLNLKK